MVLITIVNGVYKPTYNWGAPPCINDEINGEKWSVYGRNSSVF
jgi:hypothetical protein